MASAVNMLAIPVSDKRTMVPMLNCLCRPGRDFKKTLPTPPGKADTTEQNYLNGTDRRQATRMPTPAHVQRCSWQMSAVGAS